MVEKLPTSRSNRYHRYRPLTSEASRRTCICTWKSVARHEFKFTCPFLPASIESHLVWWNVELFSRSLGSPDLKMFHFEGLQFSCSFISIKPGSTPSLQEKERTSRKNLLTGENCRTRPPGGDILLLQVGRGVVLRSFVISPTSRTSGAVHVETAVLQLNHVRRQRSLVMPAVAWQPGYTVAVSGGCPGTPRRLHCASMCLYVFLQWKRTDGQSARCTGTVSSVTVFERRSVTSEVAAAAPTHLLFADMSLMNYMCSSFSLRPPYFNQSILLTFQSHLSYMDWISYVIIIDKAFIHRYNQPPPGHRQWIQRVIIQTIIGKHTLQCLKKIPSYLFE